LTVTKSGSPITLISGIDVLLDIRNNLLNGRIWPDFTKIPNGNVPSLKFRAIHPSRQITINGYRIYCEKMNHTVPAYGYIIEQTGKKTLAYTGDTGPTKLFWEKVSRLKADCLIVETSFPNSLTDLALKSGHLTPALLKNEFAKMKHIPSRIYITHSKPGYLKEIRKEIKALRMANLAFLEDNQIFTL
jgi:ribonuclease BN (tRNA processing enzyme)